MGTKKLEIKRDEERGTERKREVWVIFEGFESFEFFWIFLSFFELLWGSKLLNIFQGKSQNCSTSFREKLKSAQNASREKLKIAPNFEVAFEVAVCHAQILEDEGGLWGPPWGSHIFHKAFSRGGGCDCLEPTAPLCRRNLEPPPFEPQGDPRPPRRCFSRVAGVVGGANPSPTTKTSSKNKLPRREFKGQQNRGNRTQSLWEAICLWEGLWEGGFSEIFERFWEVFRGFQRFLEVFRGFQRFLEVFRVFWEVFRGPLRDPLIGRFPLRGSQSCCP